MRPALSLWFLVACSLVGCKKNESSTATGPGPVVLEIATLYPRDNVAWLAPRLPDPDKPDDTGYDGDPQPIVIGCDRQLGVDVLIENFTLRAPDACSDNPQCGSLVIEIDPPADGAAVAPDGGSSPAPAISGYASAPSLVLDLSNPNLPEPNPTWLEGDHVIRPRLQLPNGKPFTHPYAFEPQDVPVTFTSDACAGGAGGAVSSETDTNGAAAADAQGAGGAPAAP